MIALIQRVQSSRVHVEGELVGEIGQGLLVLLGVQKNDDDEKVKRLAERVLGYRVFPDHDGKMNLSVKDIDGELLVVSQFTLAADTRKGTRPGFSAAASPELANALYERFVEITGLSLKVKTGQFGADMQVSLLNDGPVTFWLEV